MGIMKKQVETMKNINILDSNTIDKIAAGEVVEGPKAVCKELIENSIDAGAGAITIEIKEGGISYIRITDNGEGIDRSQINKAFMRHATSKIKSIEDLLDVTSLGFRGEALSSISSVSKVELLTKTRDEFIGTRYVNEGGREMVLDDAGVPDGTTIIVRDLFYNIPARRKFLKSAQTEGNYITELIEHMILSHPEVSFKYILNGNVKLQSTGNGDILSSIYSVYGRDIASKLIEIKTDRDDISIRGYLGKPELSRGTRNFEIYFVNNRFVKSTLVERALDEAYKEYMMLHKYPVVFLYFDVPGYLIDVNVHPAKKEIRFLESEGIKDYICESVKNALSVKELIPTIEEPETKVKSIDPSEINPEPFEIKKDLQAVREQSYVYETDFKFRRTNGQIDEENIGTEISDGHSITTDDEVGDKESYISTIQDSIDCDGRNAKVNLDETTDNDSTESNIQLNLFSEDFLTEEAKIHHRVIGQLFNTYWLVEYDGKLFIIDQHAAHEKINYERMIKKLRNNECLSQNIYPPIVVSLSASEAEYVKKYADNFMAVGFTIEHFGGNDYTISTVPLELLSQNPSEYFHEMLDELMEGRFNKETDTVNLRIATMACKASVKGGMKMSLIEADKLITELLSLDNPYNCPHGRPTIVSYSKYEIEKLFKRIVN